MSTLDLLTALLAKKGGDYFAEFSAFMTQLLSDNSAILSTAGQAVTATSTTSLAIGTGGKILTLSVNKAFAVGQPVSIAVTASPTTNVMYGTVTSYDPATGAFAASVSSALGSGTYTTWTVSVIGATGPVGDAGTPATENVAGVAEIATQAETNAGTDDARIVTPLKLETRLTGSVIRQGRHALQVEAAAWTPNGTNGPAMVTTQVGTNAIRVIGLDFDMAAVERAQWSVKMPKSWDEGTVTAVFEVCSPSGTGGVVFGLRAVAVGNGDAIDAAFGTDQTATITISAANKPYVSAETSAITIAGSPARGDRVFFEAYRLATDGADTLAADARLLSVTILYNVNAATEA